MNIFGYTLVKSDELLRLRMHKKLSTETLESFNGMWPFLHHIRRICKDRPGYLQGIKDGVVGIHFLRGYSPFPKHERKGPEAPVAVEHGHVWEEKGKRP